MVEGTTCIRLLGINCGDVFMEILLKLVASINRDCLKMTFTRKALGKRSFD